MPDFKAKNPNSISAGALPQISLRNLQRSPDLLTKFNGLLLRDWRRRGEKWECYGEGKEEAGTPRVGSHPHVRNPEKYSDCRTDLIGGAAGAGVLYLPQKTKACTGVGMGLSPLNTQISLPNIINRTAS